MIPLGVSQQQVLGGGGSTLRTGLVSMWEVEEASGTRVDSHGSNDLAPINAPGNRTGINGMGLDLVRASNTYLQSGTTVGLQGGDRDYTYSCTFNLDILGVEHCLMMKGLTVEGNTDWMVFVNSAGKISPYISTGSWKFAVGTQVLTTGVDYTLIVEHIAATKTVAWSINDGAKESFVYTGTAIAPATNFWVGKYHTSVGWNADCMWDQGFFWDRLLTTAEWTEVNTRPTYAATA